MRSKNKWYTLSHSNQHSNNLVCKTSRLNGHILIEQNAPKKKAKRHVHVSKILTDKKQENPTPTVQAHAT